MSFHDLSFPVAISRGSRGGPSFRVNIITTDSGSDERVNKWPLPKRMYNARYGIRSLNDLYDVEEFFIAREGPTNGFRFRDERDFSTGARGRGAHSATDELIGTGDGSNKVFQLIKSYEKGGIYEKQRPLQKPVVGTVLVSLDGVPTTAFTLDSATGLVTLTTAPGLGVQVKAGCEFDVPVQFGAALSREAMQASVENFDVGSVPDIPLEEMNSGVSAPERFFHGGGEARVITSDTRFEWNWGLVGILVPTASAKIILPDVIDLEPGINYPFFFNAAAPASGLILTFRDVTDSTTIFSLAESSGAMSLIYTAAGIPTWGALGV